MRELNVGVLAERSDGFVLLSHEVADCPASPWSCGVGALAGQIGDLLASCGPGQRILVPIHFICLPNYPLLASSFLLGSG